MKTFSLLACVALLAGCATEQRSASVYDPYQAMNEQSVRLGTVESVREVTIASRDSGVGGMTGAALGGLAGSNVGSGKGSVAAGIAGAVAGGIIGQRAEGRVASRRGLEITIKLDNGDMVAVTQQADELFRPGERVRLLSDGYSTRVTH